MLISYCILHEQWIFDHIIQDISCTSRLGCFHNLMMHGFTCVKRPLANWQAYMYTLSMI